MTTDCVVERDVTVINNGSVFLIYPHTQTAKDWMSENLQAEGWQYLGKTLAVDQRYIADIADGMSDDGLNVEIT